MKYSIYALLLFVPPVVVHAGEPINIGSRRELFVDRFLIERMENTALKLHEPIPGGVQSGGRGCKVAAVPLYGAQR